MAKSIWSEEEEEYLKKKFPAGCLLTIAEKLTKTEASILNKAYEMGLKRTVWEERLWSVSEIKYLQQNYPTGSIIEIMKVLNVPINSIRAKAVALKIKRKNWYWNADDEIWLMENLNTMTYLEIAEKLNKTRWAVINKTRELKGLKKGKKEMELQEENL